jgi:hypothetical protein
MYECQEGRFRWDAFNDQGRLILQDYKDQYLTPQQYIQIGINYLKNASRDYTTPRWHNQRNYVEVWIEKLH